MDLRWTSVAIVPALMALTLTVAGLPRAAVAAQPTVCTFEEDVVASPGLSTAKSSGTFTSNGETGTVSCNGPVNGGQPTGQGTEGISGHYGTKGGDSCPSGGGGDFVTSFTIPTSRGAQHFTNSGTFTYGGIQQGLFAGQFQGDRMSGTFVARPTQGDCATAPVTKFHVTNRGTLK
jgi:hypothetical protein